MSKLFEELGEDIEREYLKDEMFLVEREMEIEEECRRWEEEHREPAEIEVVKPLIKKES